MNYLSRGSSGIGTRVILMVLIVLALGVLACGDKTSSENAEATGKTVGDAARATGEAVGDAAEATGEAVGDAAEATGDAARATGEFLAQPKDADIKDAQDTLDGIEKKWQQLVAEAALSNNEAKVEFQNAQDEMAATLAVARARIDEAETASDDQWHRNVKPALYAALEKSENLYEEAYARFGSK